MVAKVILFSYKHGEISNFLNKFFCSCGVSLSIAKDCSSFQLFLPEWLV